MSDVINPVNMYLSEEEANLIDTIRQAKTAGCTKIQTIIFSPHGVIVIGFPIIDKEAEERLNKLRNNLTRE